MKNTSKVNLKDDSKEEWLEKWKEHFINLLGNPPEITDKATKIINIQFDIKREQFTKEKYDVALNNSD